MFSVRVDGNVCKYTKRVCNSILPLSVGDTLPKAFEEWAFTENIIRPKRNADKNGTSFFASPVIRSKETSHRNGSHTAFRVKTLTNKIKICL